MTDYSQLDDRTLDVLIHEQLFQECAHKWTPKNPNARHAIKFVCSKCKLERFGGDANAPHAYSSNISAAMKVVEKMRTEGWAVDIADDGTPLWTVIFSKQPELKVEEQGSGEWQTLPRAICEASLAALTQIPKGSV